MSSINLLTVSNPSDYWRVGPITVPWQPLAYQFRIPPEELVLSDLRDRSGNPLLAQIDRVDPDDPSRDTLVFSLAQAIPPGAEDYSNASIFVKADRGKPMPQSLGELDLEVVYGPDSRERGVRLVNSRLIVWFNMVPAPENDGRNWYAGSATSVQLDHQEILDPFRAAMGEWIGQDSEKRCMQVDQIQLPPPFNAKLPYHQVSLFDRSYRLVSKSRGPVRVSITVASEPFEYSDLNPVTGQERHLVCELYRVFSLYAGGDYLIEELFVKGKPKKEQGGTQAGTEAIALDFAARYFTHMDVSHQPDIYNNPQVPNWFSVGSSWAPHAGYGFAADVHLSSLTYPHQGNDRRFSWQSFPAKSVKCLHLFMRCPQKDFDSRTGHSWYEFIDKPLKAEVRQAAIVLDTDSFEQLQKPLLESQQKLALTWEESQKQLSESQQKLALTWEESQKQPNNGSSKPAGIQQGFQKQASLPPKTVDTWEEFPDTWEELEKRLSESQQNPADTSEEFPGTWEEFKKRVSELPPKTADIRQESQKQLSESQQKLADTWEDSQKQLSESQQKLVDTWLDNSLPNGKIQVNPFETVQKALNFQQELVNTGLKAQKSAIQLATATQKQFWDNYFRLIRKTKV